MKNERVVQLQTSVDFLEDLHAKEQEMQHTINPLATGEDIECWKNHELNMQRFEIIVRNLKTMICYEQQRDRELG